ncbi:hypothetical protein [Sorangium sp. So ce513]|uniref:hypothetical protein n=1 Tax=Sorangium sp. So ce513 TaxID=3133315 RepID=UPI003F637939
MYVPIAPMRSVSSSGGRAVAAMSSRAAALLALALAAACGAAPERASPPAPARSAPPADPPLPSPARYVLTEGLGVLFDAADAGDGTPAPRPEPALYEGLRVRLDGGVVLAAAPASEPLLGFRSIPARLGGGFVLWSEARVYRAGDFLGDLAPIADIGAPGGARPYLDAILLRTRLGLVALDPATLSLRRFGAAGVADAVALDDRRAARLDLLGRASVTLDGGATWTDVLEERRLATTLLQERGDAVALLGPAGTPALHLTAAGLAPAPPGPPRGRPSPSLYLTPAPDPLRDAPSSRALAPDLVALAAAAGALLPGGRLLVAREGVLSVLSAAAARPIVAAEIASLDPRYARCQPFRAGEDLLLACAHEAAHVLRLESTLSAPRLEATFPPRDRDRDRDPDPLATSRGAFFGDDRGRLAFAGRCGSAPPGLHDFPEPPDGAVPGGARWPWSSAPPLPRPGELLPGEARAAGEPADDRAARVCVRTVGGRWVERRIEGDDARDLYRWIPGDRGTVIALVLEPPGGPAARPPGAEGEAPPRPPAPRARDRVDGVAAAAPEGVRVIRVRERDPALAGGVFPAPLDPAVSPRLVDADFWEDDDGAVRGWLHLPDADDAASPVDEPLPAEDAPASTGRLLSHRRGGRVAGLRIDARGGVTVFPLPAAVAHVVTGGRFALAATGDDPPAFFESTDGGRSWRPVQGPPARGIEPPFDEGTPFACSPIGCAMGDHGLVRLGWGGPPPPPRGEPPPYAPAAGPAPRAASPPLVSCRLDDDASSLSSPSSSSPPPSSLPSPRPAPRRPLRLAPAAPGDPAAPRPRDPAPPVVSLWSAPSSPLGVLRDGVFTAIVIPPFATAAPRRLSIRADALSAAPRAGAPAAAPRAGALAAVSGGAVPVLLAPGAEPPADLLLLLDGPSGRRGLRAAAARPPALLPFDHAGAIAAAVELPGGDLLALDAAKRSLLLATREATLTIAGFAHVPDVAGVRLTLGRRLDAPGLALVGYAVASGDVFAGALDVARGEVGPLEPLGSLASLREIGAGGCGGARPSHRFVAELTAALRVASTSGAPLLDEDVPAAALLAGDRGALCVEAIELRASARGSPDLVAVFGPGSGAALRGGGAALRGGGPRLRCEIVPDRP